MKKLLYLILAAGILMAPSCKREAPVGHHVAAVEKVTPMSDESGATKVFQGTEVTLTGINLDQVGLVLLEDSRAELSYEAEITSASLKELKFLVPSMPHLAQNDNPHAVDLTLYALDCETVVYNHPYFVTVPVTDALVSSYSPAEGTVGTEITINGRNLEQITAVKFGSAQIEAADFTALTATQVKFLATEVAEATEADNGVAIQALWGGDKEIDVTGETPFTLKLPVFAAASQTEALKIGDEFELTGTNLDLVSKLTWRSYDMTIAEQTATSIKFKAPGAAAETTPDEPGKFIATDALKAVYGTPDQDLTVAEQFKLDITPVGPAKPVYTSCACAETGYTLFHLGRTVTVTGQNMENVESFTVDGIAAALEGTSTGTTASFKVPASITGTAKKSVKLVALYNGGETAFETDIDVYPFFYTKGLRIRPGSNKKDQYPVENAAEAILILDNAEIVSTQKFVDDDMDTFMLSGNELITSSGKLKTDATEEQYYSVKPYLFLNTDSSNNLRFQNPANSNSQSCNFWLIDGSTKTPITGYNGTTVRKYYGTPSIYYRCVADNADAKAAIAAGTVEDIMTYNTLCGSNAMGLATSESTSAWIVGSVIEMQYVTFAHAHDAGGKPVEGTIRQKGFIVVTECTCSTADGKAREDRVGYVTFDLYWSNVIE